MKLIINADDCGKSKKVNEAISRFIEAGKVTSTTVMANMDDLDGAVRLFDQYKERVSFGLHLNLTEGKPLLYSKVLIDNGLYVRLGGGGVYFNLNPYRNKLMRAVVRRELEKELCAQVERVLDCGIRISHIDSHHHIHTGLLLLSVIPSLMKRYGIKKVRRIRNYVPGASFTNIALRNFWPQLIKCQYGGMTTTDYFGVYEDWHDNGRQIFPDSVIFELMCHPGGVYPDEERKLLRTDLTSLGNVRLINYNEF